MEGNVADGGKSRGPQGIRAALVIQMAVVIFTLSSVCSKFAGMNSGETVLFGITVHGLNPAGFRWLVLEVVCLGFYAIFWQQIIKRYDLSVAYANRAFAIFWTFLWSVVIFHEAVRPASVIGILLVFFGILLVNQDAK